MNGGSGDDLQRLRDEVAAMAARLERLERRLDAGATPAPTMPPPLKVPAATSTKAVVKERANLESRIGGHFLNRIGIIATLIGVAYFLKLAFENDWIGPSGRVVTGVAAGIAIIFWSERFRHHGFRAFAISLKGVGVGVLYLSFWAAFQLYQLVPGAVALLAMVIVTVSTMVIAWREDSCALAAMALLGGFATPQLLSTGESRPLELFSYLILLDLGALVVMWKKPWRQLLLMAYIGTLFYCVTWYGRFYSSNALWSTFAFETLFFLIFAVGPLLMPPISRPGALHASNTLIAIAVFNAATYFFECYELFDARYHGLLPWLAIAIAGVYVFLSLRMRTRLDPLNARTQHLLNMALAVGFATIAIPLKLETHWITIGWLVESAMLIWIGHRRSEFLRSLGHAALALAIFRLLAIEEFAPQRLLFNLRFFTYLVAIAALAWMARVSVRTERARDPRESWAPTLSGALSGEMGAALAVVMINVLALVGLSLEVGDAFRRRIEELAPAPGAALPAETMRSLALARNFSYSALYMAYGVALTVVGFWKRSAFLRWQALALIAFTVMKVFLWDVSQLEQGYRVLSFIALGVVLLGISYAYQKDWLRLSNRGEKTNGQ